MPDPESYENENEWMEACVSKAMSEGKTQDQAVAMCLEMWRGKGGALEMPMLMTKAERLADGRIRWQARANCGDWDLESERFDTTFMQDLVHNFSRIQESLARSIQPPDGMPVPILDLSHYSFRLPLEKRNMARAGVITRLWKARDREFREPDTTELQAEPENATVVDGSALLETKKNTALFASGYFDDTPLGRAAAKAVMKRDKLDRRVSIGVWPDWGRVKLDESGRRTYSGGRGRAYLDHLAITTCPVDPGTILEVKSMSQRQDALDFLGEEAKDLVDELEAATVKSAPDGAVIKAEETETEPQPEPEAQPEAKAEAAEKPAEESSFTRGDMEKFLKQFVRDFLASFKSALDERMGPVEAAVGEIATMKARIDALGATETAKVKAAVDNGGDWWEAMMKASVQRREPVKDSGPEQKPPAPDDPFNRMFGGLRKE